MPDCMSDAAGTPLANVDIEVFDASGQRVDFERTDATGAYQSEELLAGSYFVRTRRAPAGLIDELYNDIPCPDGGCDELDGTPVVVTEGSDTPNIDFALGAGSQMARRDCFDALQLRRSPSGITARWRF